MKLLNIYDKYTQYFKLLIIIHAITLIKYLHIKLTRTKEIIDQMFILTMKYFSIN